MLLVKQAVVRVLTFRFTVSLLRYFTVNFCSTKTKAGLVRHGRTCAAALENWLRNYSYYAIY